MDLRVLPVGEEQHVVRAHGEAGHGLDVRGGSIGGKRDPGDESSDERTHGNSGAEGVARCQAAAAERPGALAA
ncbi:MAG TPA: hypothetical protein VFO67_08265 [Gemmatimonadales bacterium]|nr:hypothetical protein [Gemmatimonadales bacterium]